MSERKKRDALRRSCLHDLLEQDDDRMPPRTNVAQEIAERVAQRLASRKPFRAPGKDLLADYRSME